MSFDVVPKLAKIHASVGFAFLIGGLLLKSTLPREIGSLPCLQLPCAFFSAVGLPLGAFFALLALILGKGPRWEMLVYHVGAVAVIVVLLGFYFFGYVMEERMLSLPDSVPNVLPRLIANAQSFPTEAQRKTEAQAAYSVYGTIIAYSDDTRGLLLYSPTAKDEATFRLLHRDDRKIAQLKAFIEMMARQFVCLFGLYSLTLLATLLIGGGWLLIRNPPAGIGAPSDALTKN